ncbi:TolB amino-terminal domain-containing protein [Myxococcus fulvus]|uniref:TolB amino-terminal domain-containing protein n=1 Tax=Myxococcus fulvus TaxID=33 RepID=A0A511TF55_MYXFU|nr:FlgO family outer membrane protein [Myxococcus fulvus]GEN12809.1 hypothetical protein MFU01_78460 [Myxococcus fulvus]SET89110.1 TolB amino-terminal domain-containing protein [Myxococcus fulvus]
MSPARALLLLLLCAQTTLAATPSKPPPGPAAVMPFRNLNGDTSMDWLARGMTETLISDLRASGRVQVVEREQLEAALAELNAQERQQLTESSAVRVGRLVGARTLVLGSIQRADQQVRINARFIDVETGVVLDTAKVTGPLERIFALQDEVCGRLLREPVKPRAGRPSGKAAVLALETYGRAMATTSPDERAWLLRATLAGSPDFAYAQEELSRMDQRLAELARKVEPEVKDEESRLRVVLEDLKRPADERSAAALQLLNLTRARGRWRTLIRDSERILALDLPEHLGRRPSEEASLYRFQAFGYLDDWDAQRVAGEDFLRRWPLSPMAAYVDLMLRTTASNVAAGQWAFEKMRADLATEEQAAALRITALEKKGQPTQEEHRKIAIRRCLEHNNHPRFRVHALAPCRTYYETWSASATTPAQKNDLRYAREAELTSLVGLRRYAEARERLAAFRQEDPDGERISHARATVLNIGAHEEE